MRASLGQRRPTDDVAAEALSQAIVGAGRIPQQRNTRYESVQTSSIDLQPAAIRWVGETPAGRVATSKTTRSL